MWSADRRERATAALKARIEQARAIRRQRRYQRHLARKRRKTAARRLAAEQQAAQREAAQRKADASKARAVRQYTSLQRQRTAPVREPNPAYAVWATERCGTCSGAGTLLSGKPCPCVVGRIARRSAERYRASPPCAWRIEFEWCVRRAGVPADWQMIRLHGQTRPQAWWLKQGGRNRMRKWDAAIGRQLLAAGLFVPHI